MPVTGRPLIISGTVTTPAGPVYLGDRDGAVVGYDVEIRCQQRAGEAEEQNSSEGRCLLATVTFECHRPDVATR